MNRRRSRDAVLVPWQTAEVNQGINTPEPALRQLRQRLRDAPER